MSLRKPATMEAAVGDRMEAGRRWWGEGEMSEDEKRRASLGARVSPSSLYSELKIKKKKISLVQI